jgi:DDE superfamily endonuclease
MEYILSDISEPEQFLQEQFNVICSISTVDRFLSGKFYSIKKIYGSVEEKNSERVKNLRMKYVEDFQHNQWRSGQCIYIDEMGFNAWMRRTHGRSKTGTRINAILPNSRGRNMSLIMAISKRGPVHHKIVTGSVTKSIYQAFLIK